MRSLEKGQYLGENKRSFFTKYFGIIETVYTQEVFEGWHFHENLHWSLLLEGGNIEHRKAAESDSIPGEIIFYKQAEWHRNTNTVFPTKIINFEMQQHWLSDNGIDENSLLYCSKNIAAKLLFLKIYKESIQPDALSEASIEMLFLQIAQLKDSISTKTPSWMKIVYEMLNDEWDKTFSLEELAKEAGVSPVTISKYFPRYFQCTLGEYMRKLKIDHSLILVKNNNISLTEVAFECGFADQSHFIRNFRHETGLLPRQYRKIMK